MKNHDPRQIDAQTSSTQELLKEGSLPPAKLGGEMYISPPSLHNLEYLLPDILDAHNIAARAIGIHLE